MPMHKTDLSQYQKKLAHLLTRNAKQKPPHNVKVQKVRERRKAGIAPQAAKTDALKAAEKNTYFGKGANMPTCDAITKKSIRANGPKRCGMPCVSGYDRCHHHLPTHVWNIVRSQRRQNPVKVAHTATLHCVRQGDITLPREAWSQPLWQSCSQALGLLRGPKDMKEDLVANGVLSWLEIAALGRSRPPAEEHESLMQEHNARRRWFAKNLVPMVHAWADFESGQTGEWFALVRDAEQAGVARPKRPVPQSLKFAS